MVDATASACNRRLLGRLLLVVAGMFAFGFALVPLYDVFCDITGLNGKTGRVAESRVRASDMDQARIVTVEFDANTNGELAWEFHPMQRRVSVHPGEIGQISYWVKNLSDRSIIAQAVPSVAPGIASKYFSKTECFCFTRQVLAPGEGREMPARFVIDPQLPVEVTSMTLSYTFFAVEDAASRAERADTGVAAGG